MNMTLLTGGPQITPESSFLDRLSLGGSTLLLGMALVFAVLGIIFVALQIMRAVFTKQAVQAKKARKAAEAARATEQKTAVKAEEPSSISDSEAPADDSAIVAAIVVAISAYTGKAPEGFRVVSFKKRR